MIHSKEGPVTWTSRWDLHPAEEILELIHPGPGPAFSTSQRQCELPSASVPFYSDSKAQDKTFGTGADVLGS